MLKWDTHPIPRLAGLGLFGFYRTSAATVTIAKILFGLFLIGAVVVWIIALMTASFVF
jgi:uncharacterized membrane protein YtjA (UPF0391 family)